jgi:hypothetical protein
MLELLILLSEDVLVTNMCVYVHAWLSVRSASFHKYLEFNNLMINLEEWTNRKKYDSKPESKSNFL